jgi:hypothetical protein
MPFADVFYGGDKWWLLFIDGAGLAIDVSGIRIYLAKIFRYCLFLVLLL